MSEKRLKLIIRYHPTLENYSVTFCLSRDYCDAFSATFTIKWAEFVVEMQE